MTLKTRALIPYSVLAVLLNIFPCWCSWLINTGHFMDAFVPVGNGESRGSFVWDDVTSIHKLNSRRIFCSAKMICFKNVPKNRDAL